MDEKIQIAVTDLCSITVHEFYSLFTKIPPYIDSGQYISLILVDVLRVIIILILLKIKKKFCLNFIVLKLN